MRLDMARLSGDLLLTGPMQVKWLHFHKTINRQKRHKNLSHVEVGLDDLFVN